MSNSDLKIAENPPFFGSWWQKNVCTLPQLLPMKDISYFYNFVIILSKQKVFINVTFMKNNYIFYVSDKEQFHWLSVTSYTANMQYGSKFVTCDTANMHYIMHTCCITPNWLMCLYILVVCFVFFKITPYILVVCFVFFKNSWYTVGVVYFRKALGQSITKMMISGVKFKIVKSG